MVNEVDHCIYDKTSKLIVREKVKPNVKQMVSLNDLVNGNHDKAFQETLHQLTSLPRRLNVSMECQMPQFSSNHPDKSNFLLTSLELGRQARSVKSLNFVKIEYYV